MNQSKATPDRFTERDVAIIAATNRLVDIDEAVVRRFDTKIYVNTLSKAEREQFLKKQLMNVSHNLTSDEISRFAMKTEGWSGSDIEMLCREAGKLAL